MTPEEEQTVKWAVKDWQDATGDLTAAEAGRCAVAFTAYLESLGDAPSVPAVAFVEMWKKDARAKR